MKYSRLIFFMLIFTFSLSCSQKKDNMQNNNNIEINSKNIVEEITKKVKRYDYEPRYFIEIGQNMGHAEIFVNGLPVYRNFEEASVSTSVSINHCIFRSGVQKITCKIYTDSPDHAFLEVNVKEFDNRKHDAPGKEVIMNRSQALVKNIDYNTQPYEYTFEFKASVPYQLAQPKEYQNLKKLGSNVLTEELKERYSKIKNLYINKDIDGLARAVYPSMSNQYISEYNNSTVKTGWNELKEVYENPTLKMQDAESYETEISEDGKFARFIQKSSDPRLRHRSVLWGLYKAGGKTKAMFNSSSFYLTEGKTKLEVY